MNTIPPTPAPTTVSSADGTGIALHPLGGSGPRLIICHATGFHGRAYAPVAAELADTFEVWALDFRAHGVSDAPVDRDFNWLRMGEDLLACIDGLGGQPVAAIGHSMGATAILLAQLSRPGVISAAYGYEPIIFPDEVLATRDGNPLAGPTRRRREVFPTRAAALERYASRPPLHILRADALHAYVKHGFVDLEDGTVRLACRADDEADTYESEDAVTFGLIDGLRLDITVGAGQRGLPPNPAEFAGLIVESIRGASLVEYPDLGHFGPLEAPIQIARDARAAIEPKVLAG